MSQFERDEFDEVAAQGGPAGVHRKKRPWYLSLITGAIVLVVAGGLGYAWTVYLWWDEGGKGLPPTGPLAAPTITQTVVETPTGEPTASAPVSPSATASPTPTATAEPVHHEAAVSVLNGAGISGLAGRTSDTLTAQGYTAVTAGNLTANKPAANVVRYADPLYETTARDIAAILGIASVERGVTPEGSVTVLLVTDPGA